MMSFPVDLKYAPAKQLPFAWMGMLMYCSLQVLQTPLVPNMDERRLRTELPNWCRIKRRNKQWHANVCVRVLSWIWSVSTILCLFFWFFLSAFTSVCVHLSFTLIIGRITAVCVQTVHKHIHSRQALSGWWNLFMCRLFACVAVHHACFISHVSYLTITPLFFPLYF